MPPGLHNVSYGIASGLAIRQVCELSPVSGGLAGQPDVGAVQGGGQVAPLSPTRRDLVPRICEWCQGGFVAQRNKVNAGRGRFCSRSCSASWKIAQRPAFLHRTGAENPNWKGGVSKGSHYRYTLRFRAKSPEKVAAQLAVQQAIRSGRLVRPESCSECGASCKPHGHHDDYSQPLIVRWLCRACHAAFHAGLRAAARGRSDAACLSA